MLKITACLVLISTVILEIWLINRLASYGEKFNQVKQTQSAIELDNQMLENEISQKSSLSFTQEKANQLGFNSTKNIEYFKPEALATLR